MELRAPEVDVDENAKVFGRHRPLAAHSLPTMLAMMSARPLWPFSMLTVVVALLVHLDDHDVDVDADVESISSDRTCC